MALVVAAAAIGSLGIDLVGKLVRAGILAEILASVGIALTLLLVFRDQDVAILGDTFGAEALSGGSVLAAMLAALAVGGWVFIGFDCAVGVAEETHDAGRHVPRAIWIALLSVGVLVIANAIAVTLAHPDPAGVVAGADLDPVTTAVTTSFGSWSDKPFAAVVLIAFLACAVAAQGVTARMGYSMARDRALPGSRWLARVDRRANPVGGIVATAVAACAGLLLGLESTAVGSLIAFGTAAIYVSFLLVAVAALVARLRGDWRPAGSFHLGRFGLPDQHRGRRLARLRGAQHRLAAHRPGPARGALLPGLGGAAGAGPDRRRRHRLPRCSPVPRRSLSRASSTRAPG